ncbi:inosine/xanthosine triphosphatase [soil metagenome]
MEVLVASRNNVKAEAVHEAFARFFNEVVNVQLSDVEIDSGVNDQPNSLEETALGAINRLKAIGNISDYDYYVAIEGGTYRVNTPSGECWFESACAAITTTGSKPIIAFGPAYPIPERFVGHLKQGMNLNKAMEIETGIQEAGNGAGFNGWLTDNQIDRQKASAEAVLLALYGLRQVMGHE